VFTEPLLRNGRLFACCIATAVLFFVSSLCVATGLYAGIFRGKFLLVCHSENASEYLRAIRRFRNTNLITYLYDVNSGYINRSFLCYVASNDDLCGTRSLLVTFIATFCKVRDVAWVD
jgi:hypothetical protein